jgi:hypothetical protein
MPSSILCREKVIRAAKAATDKPKNPTPDAGGGIVLLAHC